MKWLKTPSAEDLAKKEMEEAKRLLLVAESSVEQWTAQRGALKQKIARLGEVLKNG